MRNYIAEFTLHQTNEQTMWSSAKFWTDRLLQRSFIFIFLYRTWYSCCVKNLIHLPSITGDFTEKLYKKNGYAKIKPSTWFIYQKVAIVWEDNKNTHDRSKGQSRRCNAIVTNAKLSRESVANQLRAKQHLYWSQLVFSRFAAIGKRLLVLQMKCPSCILCILVYFLFFVLLWRQLNQRKVQWSQWQRSMCERSLKAAKSIFF